MTAYTYDPATREHIGPVEVRPDPMEADRYLVPAHATLIPPPQEQDGYARVYDSDRGEWGYEEDHRGETVYDTATKAASRVDSLGPIPEGYTTEEPGPYDVWTGSAWETDVAAKAAAEKAKMYDGCAAYIDEHYPQTKQNSDLADKLYYENLLKAAGYENLEQTIVTKVGEFYGGATLDALLGDIEDENQTAIEQLIKVGIRVAWVQRCKAELAAALTESRDPAYPEYPL
jgi:hypothetical protein